MMTSTEQRAAGDPFTGTTLGGRYRLDALIGRGGMASVYRGVDRSLGRSVAVKIFAAAAEGIDDTARRQSETALLASVEHHALVRLYDADYDHAIGREYLVMELVDGRDLRQSLRLGRMSPADAAGVAADLAEALHVIHERGIVHRDVKPANVLLSPAHLPGRRWNAKLADFGIARLIDDARLTHTGAFVGTAGYLSPEQVSGNAPGTAADVYSLGLVLLEARTGQQAFPGPATESAAARLVRDPEIPDELGPEWVALLRAMTDRDPAARPLALDVAMASGRLEVSGSQPDATASASAAASDDHTKVLPTDRAEHDSTATTRVMTRGGAESDAAVAARAVAAATRAPESRARPQRRAQPQAQARSHRWLRPVISIVLLALIAVGAVHLIPAVVAGFDSTPTTPAEPLPSLPGELGVHLQRLDDAVTR